MKLKNIISTIAVFSLGVYIGRMQIKEQTLLAVLQNTAKSKYKYSYGYKKHSACWTDIVFDTRDDAEKILSDLQDLIEKYTYVTVADLCDLVGVTPEFTYEKYGWKDLTTARVGRTQSGYFIHLPDKILLEEEGS